MHYNNGVAPQESACGRCRRIRTAKRAQVRRFTLTGHVVEVLGGAGTCPAAGGRVV
jgi:hypothetical protein